MMMMKKRLDEKPGWIKLHRKMVDWEWYDDLIVWKLFTHCLLMANFKDKKWRGKVIKKGSFITSLRHLSEESGLSFQQTRTALNKLKVTHEITHLSTNNYTEISVNNYVKYQTSNTLVNKRITNEQQTDNKRITTTKKDKKDKNATRRADKLINSILSWAYEKNNHRPSCQQGAYKRLIKNTIDRAGIEKVKKLFLNHDNAIQFLVDLKKLDVLTT